MYELYNHSYFFDGGLRFECRRCGTCCTGEPGTIYVGSLEISHIAEFFQIPVSDFIEEYLYPFRDSYSIREDMEGRCLFYQNSCTIYRVRPHQCRTFPFWFSNLRTHDAWLKVSRECPGIGHGKLYSKEKIIEIVRSTII